jgi:hypothetical protein
MLKKNTTGTQGLDNYEKRGDKKEMRQDGEKPVVEYAGPCTNGRVGTKGATGLSHGVTIKYAHDGWTRT